MAARGVKRERGPGGGDMAPTKTPEQIDVGEGSDSAGGGYASVDAMWSQELGDGDGQWYKKGIDYWAEIPATLGGFGHVTDADVADSASFLKKALNQPLSQAKTRELVALDCGAGVGRISEQFLLYVFKEVDLVEPLKHFLDQAEARLGKEGTAKDPEHVGQAQHFFCKPLETFTPEDGRYDVIWIQWVIGHLTDDDFVKFFARCEKGLKPGGFIVVKENNCNNGFVVDKDDSSVTRSDAYFRKLFAQCNMDLVLTEKQKGFPKELFPVRMYALKPKAK